MKAAVLYDAHDFRIKELPRPQIEKDECLLRVKACGVCHSEIHQWDVKLDGLEYPRYIGHEVAGEVIQTGTGVKEFKAGDRVAAWIDGKGYAEEVAVKTNALYPLNSNMPFKYAMAEPIACTVNGIEKTNIRLSDSVALVGTGFMGLILLQELLLKGVNQLIAIDVREDMLELARKLGADVTINPLKQDVVQHVKKLTGGKGVDVSFEIGGNEQTLNLAADICRMEGKLVIFGYHPGPRCIKDLGYWNWMAFDIINAHFRNMNTILTGSRIGMELLNAGKLDMSLLITHEFPLEKIEQAFQTAKDKPKGFVKSVIVI
ncbi:zinc-binding dehydrogenase [candidate division KSB1 bacterium]|nr:zinc-binding dehydrogenase [candidate division KSB1 bacterium]